MAQEKIFINYRRETDAAVARLLFEALQREFGADGVFMDVDGDMAGKDFVEELSRQVERCDVFLAVIGRGWAQVVDEAGNRRLENPKDWVRVEIEAALRQEKTILPVRAYGAEMPAPEALPESLLPFVRRDAPRVSHEGFGADLQRLVGAIRRRRAEAQVEREAKARSDWLERARREAEEADAAEAEAARVALEAKKKREAAEAAKRAAEEELRKSEEGRTPKEPPQDSHEPRELMTMTPSPVKRGGASIGLIIGIGGLATAVAAAGLIWSQVARPTAPVKVDTPPFASPDAVQAELHAAMEAGSIEKLDEFINNHPTDPAAKIAQFERARLIQSKDEAEINRVVSQSADTAAEREKIAREKDEASRREIEARRTAETLQADYADYNAAMEAGTVEAFDAFIARHSKSALVKAARSERDQLKRRKQADRRAESVAKVASAVGECDQLAASKVDPDRPVGVAGVDFDEIDPDLAGAACAEAVKLSPSDGRMAFQYGRALEAAKKYEEAFHWYRRAADAGNSGGMNSLGWMYRHGRAIARNFPEAVRWFRKAADAKNSYGMYNLGTMYESGSGVAKDMNEALRLFRLAADKGVEDAKRALTRLDPAHTAKKR